LPLIGFNLEPVNNFSPCLLRIKEGIPVNVSLKELYSRFSVFGEILSLKINTDPQGKLCGSVEIYFKSEESAETALMCLD